jgi:PAS domain S-box-containing protein
VNLSACGSNRLAREQQVGRGLLEILPAHQQTGRFDKYCRVIETGEPLDIEEILYEDVYGGERVAREFAIRVSKLDDGFVVAWRVITERKRTEEALRETLNFLKRIADISPAVLYVYDLVEGRAVYHNGEIAALLGYAPDEVLAMGEDVVATLMHPEDQLRLPAHFSMARELSDGEKSTFEFRMKDTSGGWHWFYTHDSVFARDAEGKATQLIGAALEISARKDSEEALRASEERHRMAAEVVSGLIYEWDVATDRVERSSGLFAVAGFHPEEAESTAD